MESNEQKQLVDEILASRNIFSIERQNVETNDNLAELFIAIGQRLTNGKFTITKENSFVYQNCLKWLINQPFKCIDPETKKAIDGDLKKGLYISGKCGSGKSLMLTILAAISQKYAVKYITGNRTINLVWAENRADDICNEVVISGVDIITRMRNIDVLNLNDFGSGTAEQIYMGNRINAIRLILEARADMYGKFTLITSNLPMNEKAISDLYGDRVASRLNSMCNYFILNENDWRQKK